jgi:hypothetical protein
MPVFNATIGTVYNTGQQNAVIAWSYVDDSDGTLVIPTSPVVRLFDTNDVQRDPADTANTSSSTTTPTRDSTGSVTGVVGKYYINVNLANNATVGTWYISTTFTWEGVTRSQNIAFVVVSSGASVASDTIAPTVPVYACAKDVELFIMSQVGFDVNSNPSSGAIDSYIMMAEGEWDRRTGKPYKPVLVINEIQDQEAWRSRHHDVFFDSFGAYRPVQLNNKPLLPFDATRGHKIELYEGSDTSPTAADPWGEWGTDFITDRTYGRDADWWSDYERGVLYVRKAFLYRRHALWRVTYEYGKPITTTTSTIAADASTIPVRSTFGYQNRGLVRIGTTYYHHTGKTATSFTGVKPAAVGTTADTYAAGSEVYEVPDDVRRLITMRAASLFMQNERFVAIAGDNAGSGPNVSTQVQLWEQQWEQAIGGSYQRWGLL